MPDDLNNQAADTGANTDTGEKSETGADQGTDKKPVATDTGSEDAGTGEGKDGEGDDKDTSQGKDKDAKAPPKETPPKEGEDDGSEPPQRKRLSKQDFIIGRQKAKLAKKQDKPADDTGTDDTGTDDDGVAKEDKDLIIKVVGEQFAPIIEKSLADDDNKEVNDFLTENPDFKPFEAKVRRYMLHPSRRALPIEAIFFEVAGKALIKIGAERQKAADLKAKGTQTGGGSNRSGEGTKLATDKTKEEFEAEQDRVRRGQ